METNNPYEVDIDFAVLALQDADFAKILKSNGQLDFSNPESVQQLTKSLLKRDFGLTIELPPDRLCPPVPNRINYVLWVQNLLDSTSDSYSDRYDPGREVIGLDIGTGASCIYPLLGCAQRPKWRFAGTDIDDKSLQFAKKNVVGNHLQDRIKLLQTQSDSPLLPLDIMGLENIDFSMCNPPFYESTAEMLASAKAKQRPAFTACTGSETEMVTEGGEVAFVSKIIDESLILCHRVQWYTSMLGKFSSVATVIEKLRAHNIGNYAATEFIQGNKTRRWGIAWSFEDMRPKSSVARGLHSLPKSLLPFPSEYVIQLTNANGEEIGRHVNETLSLFPLKWMWKPTISTGVGFTDKAVWSRAVRRHSSKDQDMDEENIALGFKIHVGRGDTVDVVKVVIRWLRGHETVLFESFCGMVKRKLEETK